jgi:hypothetical protein
LLFRVSLRKSSKAINQAEDSRSFVNRRDERAKDEKRKIFRMRNQFTSKWKPKPQRTSVPSPANCLSTVTDTHTSLGIIQLSFSAELKPIPRSRHEKFTSKEEKHGIIKINRKIRGAVRNIYLLFNGKITFIMAFVELLGVEWNGAGSREEKKIEKLI